MQPDVTAFELSQARSLLEAAGWKDIVTRITKPPRGGEPVGEARVVRQTRTGQGVLLVLAYRSYT